MRPDHAIRTVFLAILLAIAGNWLTSAKAADIPPMPVKAAPPVPAISPWRYDITPYFWMPSLNGTSTVRGFTGDIDATFFGDIIHRKIPKELFGLMTSFEARNDRFALMGDFVYMKIGADKSGTRVVNLGPVAAVNIGASAQVTINMIVAEMAAAYELVRFGPGTALDIYGGGRVWWQDADSSLFANAALIATLPRNTFTISGSRAIAESGDITWVDPMVGARLRHQFSPGRELMLRGDVGGFGAGSKFSWQAIGALNWEVARTQHAVWSGMVGYRALYVDYSKGSGNTLYEYDMLQHGPIVGLSARF